MRTYCRAEMKFIDVTALADAAVTTDDNQSIGSVGLFADQTKQSDYGTFELNQFILDGSKSVLPENPNDIAFWSEALSRMAARLKRIPKSRSHLRSSIHPQRSHFILKMSHQQS